MLTLRCRHAGGALTLQADGGWCVAQLLTHVAGLTGVPLPRLLHGFPPAPLDAASEAPLCSLLRSGDVLVCEPDPTPAPPATVAPRPPPESGRAAASAPVVIPPELPEHVALPNAFGAVLVRRIIAADNSCLCVAACGGRRVPSTFLDA